MVSRAKKGNRRDSRAVVGAVRDECTGEVLTVETGPEKHGGRLLPNGTLEVAQQVGGFFGSSLYPGSWDAVTTVELTYPSGRADRLDVPFAFQ